MSEETVKVAVISESDDGSADFLKSVIASCVGSGAICFGHFDVAELLQSQPEIAFVVIEDEPLSSSSDGLLVNRISSPTIRKLNELVQVADFPVHVMIETNRFSRSARAFTPVETVALSMSGVAGIWELKFGLSATLIGQLEELVILWRRDRIFLCGRVADQLFEFYTPIDLGTWPLTTPDDEANDPLSEAYVKYCFLTALALASLSVEQMTPREKGLSGKKSGAPLYANQLLVHKYITGFGHSPSTITNAIRYLIQGWRERIPNYSSNRMNEMPNWARNDGFPLDLPLIPDCMVENVPVELHKGLKAVSFERDWEPGTSDYTTIASLRRR